MDTSVDMSFEAVPKYFRLPRSVLRDQLRTAGLAILAAGQRVSVLRLREHGIRGATAALIALREELVAAGELPPEAAARVYAPAKHAPGKAVHSGELRMARNSGELRMARNSGELRVASCERIQFDSLATVHSPPASAASDATIPRAELTKVQRRMKRLVRRYYNAARYIFGPERARQIGASP